MAIRSRSAKPSEWASKANHSHIINDPYIKNFVGQCDFPKESEEINDEDKRLIENLDKDNIKNPIKYLLGVDGGYTVVDVKKSFPSSQIAFLQIGALFFELEDLENLSEKDFIFPEDMNKLQDLSRFKLAIPIKNVKSKDEVTLVNSIRKAIYEFFMETRDNSSFMETLYWFIFEEYKGVAINSYVLASNPNLAAETGSVELIKEKMNADYSFDINGGKIYLTDIFRLHEAIDEEQGAMGILGYLIRLIEQFILVHYIKYIYKSQPKLLNNFLFIADGPLGFFGQTANMHKPMREMCNFILEKENLFLVGIEKSGAFVDHAYEICNPPKGNKILKEGAYMLLNNNYIYKYIIPGDPNGMPYGSTSYYSGKVIFHSDDDQIYVVTIPVRNKNVIKNPNRKEYNNIEKILINIQKLRCDMYDDSIVPIALANKLVSLANHPSKIILEKFATSVINDKRSGHH